jgi:hypothetical protein
LRYVRGKLFEQGKVNAVSRNGFDSGEPDGMAIAEFVKLAGLSAKYATKVVGSFPLHDGSLIFELVDEEAAAHLSIIVPRKANKSQAARRKERFLASKTSLGMTVQRSARLGRRALQEKEDDLDGCCIA